MGRQQNKFAACATTANKLSAGAGNPASEMLLNGFSNSLYLKGKGAGAVHMQAHTVPLSVGGYEKK